MMRIIGMVLSRVGLTASSILAQHEQIGCLWPSQQAVADLLGDHDCWNVGVGRRQARHDGRIGDKNVLGSNHLSTRVDDGVRVCSRAHPARSTGVPYAKNVAPDKVVQAR